MQLLARLIRRLIFPLAACEHEADTTQQEDRMANHEVIAPSKGQRWAAIVIVIVVGGVVVTRGGTPQSTRAESLPLLHEDVRITDQTRERLLDPDVINGDRRSSAVIWQSD